MTAVDQTEPEVQTMTPTGRAGGHAAWWRALVSEYMVLFLTLAYFLAVWPFLPEFNADNLAAIFFNMLPLLPVAIGQTLVLIVGGIDLSVTAVIAMASVTGAYLMTAGEGSYVGGPWPVWAALSAMLLVGILVGLFNGLSVTLLRMPPFIVTLTTMMLVSGIAVWVTRSRSIWRLPPDFISLSYGQVVSVPIPLLIAAPLALVMHLFLQRTVYGQWLFAVGANPRTALVSGVPVRRVILMAYILCGAGAALSGVLYTARLRTGSPTLGNEMLLDIIGAVVIGGTSLFGGKGSILWTVLGVLFLALLMVTLDLLNLSAEVIMMAKGVVILLAASLDLLRNRMRGGAV